jgi:hypothetical protein
VWVFRRKAADWHSLVLQSIDIRQPQFMGVLVAGVAADGVLVGVRLLASANAAIDGLAWEHGPSAVEDDATCIESLERDGRRRVWFRPDESPDAHSRTTCVT